MVSRSPSADVRLLELGSVLGERRLVVDPALARPFQRDEVLDTVELAADARDSFDVVAVVAMGRYQRGQMWVKGSVRRETGKE
jgi:hypothetical protein